jgi:2-phospho-L-lactate transferase/gluconeogenesis factor (CofD/UPF0052 family)
LQKDYIVSDEIDEIEEFWTEAEENKEKILFSEEKIIEVSEILEENDKILEESSLEELLWDDVDLVWKKFIKRTITQLNSISEEKEINNWIYDENIEDDEKELEEEKIIDLEEYYENLKIIVEELEIKKKKIFLNWDYDLLDDLNDELLIILVKLKKVWILLWDTDEED